MGYKMKQTTERYIQLTALGTIFVLTVSGILNGFKPMPEITTYFVAKMFYVFTGVMPAIVDSSMLLNIDGEIIVLDVSMECSGLIVMLLFAFVMFLTPHIKLSHRFGSLMFIPALYLVNIFRIVSEILLGNASNIHYMQLYHSSVGQVTFFGAMIVAYLGFLYMFGYLGNVRKYQEM